jgi:hypothetical protein
MIATCAGVLLSILLSPAGEVCAQQRTSGTNLSWLRYWIPQMVFQDAFRQSAPWMTRNASSTNPWNTNTAIPAGPDGYPAYVPFGEPAQYAHTVMFTSSSGKHPAGTYTLLSEGTGTIQLEWDGGNHTFASPGVNAFAVTPTNQGIHLTITQSSAADPVRNIRVVLPGCLGTYESDPFHPAFLNYLDSTQVFSAIRFKDFMSADNSPLRTWSERTTPTSYTQASPYGIAYEYMVELANRLDKDMWVSIPHQADDAYVLALATLLRDGVAPGHRVYVEYSNETWNYVFQQHAWCNARGAELGYPGPAHEQGYRYYAKRSADVHRIFEDVFGSGSPRLVKVVSSQAAAWVSNYILTRYHEPANNPTGVVANALAIAPYFGGGLADSIGAAGAITTTTVPDLLRLMRGRIYSQALPGIVANAAVASSFGVDLIAYESGSHLIANNAQYQADTSFTNKILAANRDPEMEHLYCEYFDAWYGNGGGMMFHFTNIGIPGQWGSLGILDHTTQPLVSSAKWRGIHACAGESLPAAAEPGVARPLRLSQNQPNPFAPSTTIRFRVAKRTRATLRVYSVAGQEVLRAFDGEAEPGRDYEVRVDGTRLRSGVYFYRLSTPGWSDVKRMVVLR